MQEHHDLTLEQLKLYPPPDKMDYSVDTYDEYTELISKNNQHRFKDINSVNKTVKVYAQPNSDRCIVCLLDYYISNLPEDPPGFYLRPFERVPVDATQSWYCKSRLGVNTLKKFVPDMSTNAGLSVRYTNHSLLATAVTRMYNTGVPEKVISDISGHKSLKALRAYERTSIEQQKSAGESIQSGKPFIPEANEENFDNSSAVVKCASLEPSSAADSVESFKAGSVSKESLNTLQQFSSLQGCTFNFYQSN